MGKTGSWITPARKGIATKPALIIASFFIVLILLAVTNEIVGSTALFMKAMLLDVQANRVVDTGMALDSMSGGSQASFDMSGYSIRYDDENAAIVVGYGDQTASESAKPLNNAYDAVNLPSDSLEIEGDIVLRKEVEDGDPVLNFETGDG